MSKSYYRTLAAAVTGLLLGSHSAIAQEGTTTLTVSVVDSATLAPVSGARVEVGGIARPEFTDASGVARIARIPAGQRIVEVRRVGYGLGRVALQFGADDQLAHRIAIPAVPVQLDAVTGIAARRSPALERNGFYSRERAGFGAFLREDQIERLRPMRTLDLFRHMRGFRVGLTARGEILATTRGEGMTRRSSCAPMVYLDGLLLSPRGVNAADLVNVVSPEDLAAIEAFAGLAQIPPQYNATGSACGVVLLWTRT